MSSGIDGGENTPAAANETAVFQVGTLVEDMQSGLMRILGLEKAFAALRDYQQRLVDHTVDLDEAQKSVEELQAALPEDDTRPNRLFEFLNDLSSGATYNTDRVGKVGHMAILLGAQGKTMAREHQAWAEGPVPQAWLGKSVILQRPSVDAIREDPNVPNTGPLSRLLEKGKPSTKYYPGGDLGGHNGKLEEVSLEQNGRLVLNRGAEGNEIIELFEAIKDPATGEITHYLPRVAVKALSRRERAKRKARSAAIKHMMPELPEETIS